MALRFDSWIIALTIKIPNLLITSLKAFCKPHSVEPQTSNKLKHGYAQKDREVASRSLLTGLPCTIGCVFSQTTKFMELSCPVPNLEPATIQ